MLAETFLTNFGAEYIKARTGATITTLAKLQDAKYREEYNLYIAEGVKLVREALRHSTVERIIVCESALQNSDIEKILCDALQNCPHIS